MGHTILRMLLAILQSQITVGQAGEKWISNPLLFLSVICSSNMEITGKSTISIDTSSYLSTIFFFHLLSMVCSGRLGLAASLVTASPSGRSSHAPLGGNHERGLEPSHVHPRLAGPWLWQGGRTSTTDLGHLADLLRKILDDLYIFIFV